MNSFLIMLKTNLKLLLRNKGYLSFLIILPMFSVIILNVNNVNMADSKENTYAIQEMKTENALILNVTNAKINIKVYDNNHSPLSDYILKELAKIGAYHIYRYSGDTLDHNKMKDKALYSLNHNVIGAVIYIPETFDDKILSGKESNMVLYDTTEDGRTELLENNLNTYLKSLYRYAATVNYNKEDLLSILQTSTQKEMKKEIKSIEVGDTLNLSVEQMARSSSIGYSLSFLTISFLFSGVFIAATVVEEKNNRVYNRFVLSMKSLGNYAFVKFVMILLTVLVQTGIIAVGIKVLVKADFGIPYISYLFLVFCMGLIFNLLSVVIGVVTNNVLTSIYIAFLVWCLSSLMAGLYFPLDGASKWWSRVSMLMPQRWVVKTSELIMIGKNNAYSSFIYVVLSFLVVIMSVGLIGIKIRRKE